MKAQGLHKNMQGFNNNFLIENHKVKKKKKKTTKCNDESQEKIVYKIRWSESIHTVHFSQETIDIAILDQRKHKFRRNQ